MTTAFAFLLVWNIVIPCRYQFTIIIFFHPYFNSKPGKFYFCLQIVSAWNSILSKKKNIVNYPKIIFALIRSILKNHYYRAGGAGHVDCGTVLLCEISHTKNIMRICGRLQILTVFSLIFHSNLLAKNLISIVLLMKFFDNWLKIHWKLAMNKPSNDETFWMSIIHLNMQQPN